MTETPITPSFDQMAARFTARVSEAAGWKHNYIGAAYSTRIKAAIANLRDAIAEAEQSPEIALARPTSSGEQANACEAMAKMLMVDEGLIRSRGYLQIADHIKGAAALLRQSDTGAAHGTAHEIEAGNVAGAIAHLRRIASEMETSENVRRVSGEGEKAEMTRKAVELVAAALAPSEPDRLVESGEIEQAFRVGKTVGRIQAEAAAPSPPPVEMETSLETQADWDGWLEQFQEGHPVHQLIGELKRLLTASADARRLYAQEAHKRMVEVEAMSAQLSDVRRSGRREGIETAAKRVEAAKLSRLAAAIRALDEVF